MSAIPRVREERGPADRLALEGLGIGWTTTTSPPTPRPDAFVRLIAFVVGISVMIAATLAIAVAPSTAPDDGYDPGSAVTRAFEARTGIRLLSVSLAAGGGLIDVRYQVLDVAKTRETFERSGHPILVDEATGMEVGRAVLAVGGGPALRTSLRYSTVLENPGLALGRDGLVTVVVGDARLEHLPVG